MRTFQTCLGVLILCLIAIAFAGRDDAGTTASLDLGDEAQPLVRGFAAGAIRGELFTTPEDGPISAGRSVFAQIKLSADSVKRSVGADLVIEADHGEIGAITGASGEVRGDGQLMRASVDGLRKGRDRLLLVEVKLPRMRSGRSSIRVTLNAAGNWGSTGAIGSTNGASAELSWTVKDCASSYSTALRQIRDNPQWRPMERWREAAIADPGLPRSWLFAASGSRPRRSLAAEPETTSASTTGSEREIFAEADKLVRARKDPALDRDGPLGWSLGRLAGDLEGYLTQPPHPAICVGARGLMDYHQGRLDGLAQRGRQLARLAADAKGLARWRVETAFRSARELRNNRQMLSAGMTPIAARSLTVRGDTLTALTASLAELAAVPQPTLLKIWNAPTPYDALIRVAEAGFERDGMPYPIRDDIRAALAALDAAARLEIGRQRHAALQSAFEGRLKAIRAAHAAHCVCQS
jgi:hypothetical protein